MANLKVYGRVFYGLGIVGIGILHFFFKGFRPVILPVPAESTTGITGLIYILAIYILISGILIVIGKNVRNVSLLLGIVFLLFVLFGHLPIRLNNHPEISGIWIDAIKLFALSGGAFVASLAFAKEAPSKFLYAVSKIAPAGRYFFAFMLVFFGTGHLIGPQGISRIVPPYIPWPLFWTLLAGVALVGSGIAIFINFKLKYMAVLLGVMLFLWFVLLHLYFAIRFPYWRDGENIIGSFECLAFSGIALMIARTSARKTGRSATAS